jgi:hypothetical protein
MVSTYTQDCFENIVFISVVCHPEDLKRIEYYKNAFKLNDSTKIQLKSNCSISTSKFLYVHSACIENEDDLLDLLLSEFYRVCPSCTRFVLNPTPSSPPKNRILIIADDARSRNDIVEFFVNNLVYLHKNFAHILNNAQINISERVVVATGLMTCLSKKNSKKIPTNRSNKLLKEGDELVWENSIKDKVRFHSSEDIFKVNNNDSNGPPQLHEDDKICFG